MDDEDDDDVAFLEALQEAMRASVAESHAQQQEEQQPQQQREEEEQRREERALDGADSEWRSAGPRRKRLPHAARVREDTDDDEDEENEGEGDAEDENAEEVDEEDDDDDDGDIARLSALALLHEMGDDDPSTWSRERRRLVFGTRPTMRRCAPTAAPAHSRTTRAWCCAGADDGDAGDQGAEGNNGGNDDEDSDGDGRERGTLRARTLPQRRRKCPLAALTLCVHLRTQAVHDGLRRARRWTRRGAAQARRRRRRLTLHHQQQRRRPSARC